MKNLIRTLKIKKNWKTKIKRNESTAIFFNIWCANSNIINKN